jgi:hypothetical protein
LAYGLTGKAELDQLFDEAKTQEPIGPYYCDTTGEPPITYPMFIRGKTQDMRYFTGPLERTLYYIQACDKIQQSTVVGRIVPKEELESHLHLSQLSQDFSGEEPPIEGFLESTQAYTLLYPTFKQIICLATADRELASLSHDALKSLHKTLLEKLAPNSEANKKNPNIQTDYFGLRT